MNAMYDYLIVGAGLYGACFAWRATRCGKRCLVIDRRAVPGGNLRCEQVEGIDVHTYGAHIFHTSDAEVWDLVTSLVPFNRFINSPLAMFEGQLYNLPFNMNTFYRIWGVREPEDARRIIAEQREEVLRHMQAEGRTEPRNLEEQALLLVGRDIYRMLVEGYTRKQWGRPCDQLPPFIIRRLPVRFTFDNNYFNDRWQGVPVGGGYNGLIGKLLEGSEVRTGADFFDDRPYWESLAREVVYTGPIDRYYGYRFGRLAWRSLRFEQEILDRPNFQGNAVVNYTGLDVPYTRIIEHKHFTAFGDAVYENPRTVITREYSCEREDGAEPFYPVNDAANTALYERYATLARQETAVHFGGRLAEYRYYDMGPLIATVLERTRTLFNA